MLEKISGRDIQPPKINLSGPGQTPFRVEMQGYFEFCFWMAEELLDLEARFRPNNKQKPDLVKK